MGHLQNMSTEEYRLSTHTAIASVRVKAQNRIDLSAQRTSQIWPTKRVHLSLLHIRLFGLHTQMESSHNASHKDTG